MPYDNDRDEYYWGTTFSRDGSDYDPGYPSPKLSDAYRVLSNHFGSDTPISIIVTGKMYKGKGSKISGVSANIDLATLQTYATGIGLSGKAVSHGGGGYSIEQKVAQMLGLNEVPEHITGIYFRPLV